MQAGPNDPDIVDISVHAPAAELVELVVDGVRTPMERSGSRWLASLPSGTRYGLVAHGPAESGFDPGRTLVDPSACEVWFPEGHSRAAAWKGEPPNHDVAPLAVARRWPGPFPQRHTSRPLVVYEAHARGLTKRRPSVDAGTFAAIADELPRLADLGVSVLELLPVHQFDPDEGNYWGYMPLVFGAVHRQYAAGGDAPAELAELIARAHDRDIEVWLDVVFNHTTELGADGPVYSHRGLAAHDYYATTEEGDYLDDAGTGNIIDTTSPFAQDLVMEGLDRLADLGVDGFRFDLATVLARDPEFVRRIGDWASRRLVRLVAEPWDMSHYQLGDAFPDARWMQWNDRFRDDVRGFLRGEPGLVSVLRHRVAGSDDLFPSPTSTVNFLTAHDGFTLYDLVAYNHRRNEANGWGGTDGHEPNRSWNCGHEGDEGVPDEVMTLRRRQMRNALCLLFLSAGVPMFVAGDEFARTQHGNNNAYNQDNEISWIDWDRRDQFLAQEEFVRGLIELRSRQPALVDGEPWGDDVEWFGAEGPPDVDHHSRSIGWALPGLVVMANMWWEPVHFDHLPPGNWTTLVDTTHESGFVEPRPIAGRVEVAPRSIRVLTSPVD